MEHSEMVELIRGGVAQPGGHWADFGAGTGKFTWALAELLGPDGQIDAFDRDAKAIDAQRDRMRTLPPVAAVRPQQADITRPIALPPLDGVLMANLLHFIRDQPGLLARIAGMLRPGGALLVVEYDQALPIPWVPFPVPPSRLASLASGAGFSTPREVGRRVSPSSGRAMYAALAGRVG